MTKAKVSKAISRRIDGSCAEFYKMRIAELEYTLHIAFIEAAKLREQLRQYEHTIDVMRKK